MIALRPDDDANRALLAAVRPAGWENPTPSGRYDLVVVGAGTAGLVTAAAAAGLGGRVALVERHLLGGDCLHTGCVPSKSLLASGREAAARATPAAGARDDFAAAMRRMREVRAGIAPIDGAERFRDLGVDVHFGEARFVSDRAVEVAGARLDFVRAVIATGARPAVPPIPGLEEAGYLTSDTVFELTELPASLAVIGGGPIGCELSQAFAELGAQVTLFQSGPRILPADDADAAEVVRASLARSGVAIRVGAAVERVEADGAVVARAGGEEHRVRADAILVATGRRANTESLALDAAGVATDERGQVIVDERLRTGARRIYAAGDVCGRWQFTHAADAMARLVVRNALFFGRARASDLRVPWVTYTAPELAQVGLTAAAATEQGLAVDRYEKHFADVDRALTDGDTDGFVRVLTRRGTDRIVGATVVGAHAGELVAPLVLAMKAGVGLGTFGDLVLPYPTRALALKALGDAYSRTRLTPRVARLLGWILARRR